MITTGAKEKRAIVVLWKNNTAQPIEVFSNLKNFCLSYPQYNYNTISNYVRKAKVAYENADIRIERKSILSKPKPMVKAKIRQIAPVLRKVMMNDAKDEDRDLEYWLSRPVKERAAAVTFIISQSLKKGERMDKTKLVKKSIYA